MPSTWTPSIALKTSFALHGAAALGTLAAPAEWPWALAAAAANHAVITTAGLFPRSTLLGPNITHLPPAAAARNEIVLSFDDGPDPETTPRVLDLLDAVGAKASFFCIGWRARNNPTLCREIANRGHHVENHGDTHSNAFSLFGPGRMKADIAAAQSTLSEITGRAPRFFRPTAGLRNLFLDPVLASLDLQLASWTRRAFDSRESNPTTIHDRLTRNLAAGDLLLLHDGYAARTPTGEPAILAALPLLLATLKSRGLTPVTLADTFV